MDTYHVPIPRNTIKSDEESFVVAGVVLPGLRPSECHVGGALSMKALFALLTASFFTAALMKASFRCAPIKKPGSSIQAFSSSGGRTYNIT